ncbi:MAG: iron ABC transporter permease [Bacteroidota bacterium]
MNKARWILVSLGAGLILVSIWSMSQGAVKVSWWEIFNILGYKLGLNDLQPALEKKVAIFWLIRFPRVLMSVFVGMSLAICGTAMQGLFRNPLADPSLIGISTGAALAAALVIVLGGTLAAAWGGAVGMYVLSIATFTGAVVASFLVFFIGREKGRTNVATMLLAGIAINALAGAMTGLLTYLADDVQLRDLTFWTLGSLGGTTWGKLGIVSVASLISLIIFLNFGKAFNALSLGEEEASYLGIEVERLKFVVVLATGLAIGCSVAFCGVIGFVGLVVPHLLRILGGADHHYLLPASALGGGLLLAFADTVSRTLLAPAELPIGILTALVGAPFFLFLLYQQRLKFE